MTSLTRRYRFSASHRLHSAELSPAENARLFGKCNNPYGHGHDYALEITVTGPADRRAGLILPIATLDRLVEEKVLRAFAWRNLNLDVPQFATRTPTTENVALIIADILQQHWREYLSGTSAGLSRVYIQETERNSFEVLLGAAPPARSPRLPFESIVHA